MMCLWAGKCEKNFCILKINEERNRIRIWIRFRIHKSISQRYGSGDPDPFFINPTVSGYRYVSQGLGKNCLFCLFSLNFFSAFSTCAQTTFSLKNFIKMPNAKYFCIFILIPKSPINGGFIEQNSKNRRYLKILYFAPSRRIPHLFVGFFLHTFLKVSHIF